MGVDTLPSTLVGLHLQVYMCGILEAGRSMKKVEGIQAA